VKEASPKERLPFGDLAAEPSVPGEGTCGSSAIAGVTGAVCDAVNGVFDYDGAAWADRHQDFRYLLFDIGREDMLDAAPEVYEPAAGRHLDRGRIRTT
jgi:hypothetical protein